MIIILEFLPLLSGGAARNSKSRFDYKTLTGPWHASEDAWSCRFAKFKGREDFIVLTVKSLLQYLPGAQLLSKPNFCIMFHPFFDLTENRYEEPGIDNTFETTVLLIFVGN